MTMSRRRSRSRRAYSLGYLLEKQPKGLRKHPQYSVMIAHFRASRRLQQLRLSRRCYTLLNNARVQRHNLVHFYRTYRLPADPFFPLFFAIKREYLAERLRIKEERHRYIVEQVRALPGPVLATIRYLGHLERYYNSSGTSPIWQKELFPGSKKQVREYRRQDATEWLRLFRSHLQRLQQRYGAPTEVAMERILACFVLGIIPERIPPQRPDSPVVSRTYRKLSLLHHPDRGGDPSMFIEIKRARDTLLRESSYSADDPMSRANSEAM